MRQVLIHPGFHKTGTSSMQHFLWLNREVLAPHLSLLLLRHMKPAVKDCARFSRSRNPVDLVDLASRLDDAMIEFAPVAGRHLLVSSEGLFGHLPGWPGVVDYGAAPMLASYLTGYFAECLPDAQVRVVLTTRDAEGWLFSAYRHHLRSHRLTLDYVDFARTHEAAAQLDRTADVIAAAVHPVPVATLPMSEALQHPLGPGAALVTQLPLPAGLMSGCTPVGRGNKGPDDALWQSFLELNRSELSDAEVEARKRDSAEEANLGGWRPA